MFQNSALPSVSVDITRNIAGSLPRIRHWQGLARLDALLPLPRTLREYLAWLLIFVGVAALALLQVWVTLQISQTQMEANTLRSQYVLVEQANAQLLWEISHYTTLERIEVEAAAAGFVPALKRRYVQPETAQTLSPALPPDSAVLTEAPENSAWSVDVNADTTEMSAQFSHLWDGWTAQWQQLRQSAGESLSGLGDAAQEQWMQIDISRFIWIGSPSE